MGLLDRLLGHERSAPRPSGGTPDANVQPRATASAQTLSLADEQALTRYRYLLRMAPPEALEEVHAEAFGRLSPEQRVRVLREIAGAMPSVEAPGGSSAEDPRALARFATRAELRRPGVLARILRAGAGGAGMAPSASLASSFVAGALGSLVAQQLLSAAAGGFFGGGPGDETIGSIERGPSEGRSPEPPEGTAGEDVEPEVADSGLAADERDGDFFTADLDSDFPADDFLGSDFGVYDD